MDFSGALSVATEKLGFTKLKAEQEAVIASFLSGHDVFAALPTGYGKSLCYVPTLFGGRC